MDNMLKIPTQCPSCNGPLEITGEYLMCISSDICPDQIVGRIINWLNNLNILEWGSKLVERLVETNKVKTIVDLYKLSIDDLAGIERMGEKSAAKCHKILWEHNPLSLESFIGGLSIPMVGSTIIKLLIDDGYDSLDKIVGIKKEDLLKIKGLGPAKSESIYNGLKRNSFIIGGLLDVGIKIKEKIMGKLSDKSFALTGKMEHKRKDLEDLIIKNGGSIKSVGRNLTYLVINDLESTSSKTISAKKLGTTLINELELLNMIK